MYSHIVNILILICRICKNEAPGTITEGFLYGIQFLHIIELFHSRPTQLL